MPLGVLIGCCGQWYIAQGRRASDSGSGGSRREKKQEAVIYEEPEPKPAISLGGNIAYGQVQGQKTTAIPITENVAYEHVQRQRT